MHAALTHCRGAVNKLDASWCQLILTIAAETRDASRFGDPMVMPGQLNDVVQTRRAGGAGAYREQRFSGVTAMTCRTADLLCGAELCVRGTDRAGLELYEGGYRLSRLRNGI